MTALVTFVGIAQADVVTDWNNVYLDAIRGTAGGAEQGRGGPFVIARNGAILQAAIYDAVNSIDRRGLGYHSMLDGTGADTKAAVAAAGYNVMRNLYQSNPALQQQFTNLYNQQLASIGNSEAKTRGIALGAEVASRMLAARANDGATSDPDYTPGGGIGDYAGHFHPNARALGSGWTTAQSFTLNSNSQFRPAGAPSVTSAQYTAAYNQVKAFGAANSSVRTADQTQIAWFWANDRDGTSKPPGQLNQMTQVLMAQQFAGMSENDRIYHEAKLLALTNIGMADAAIAAWDAKYATNKDFWRPIEGIRAGDFDGNAGTEGDVNWRPLSEAGIGGGPYTPPFPAYISGHSTFAGAHAAILAAYFGTDALEFDLGTDDPDAAGIVRHFTSISHAAEENAHSRIYLGVHWLFDCDDGLATGRAVGAWAMANAFAVPTPGAAVLVGCGLMATTRRRRA